MIILLCLLSLLLVQQPVPTEFATISGQLRDNKGAPTPGLRVFAMPADGDDTLISITQADTAGRYRLEGLPAGRYVIAAGALDSPVYFPGVATRNKGQVLTVAAGQAITNLDFAIAIAFPSLPPQLWGKVQFDDGSPLQVGTLQGIVLILSSDTAHWTTQPFTNGQGTFFFQSVRPGNYFFALAPLPFGYGYYLKSVTFGNMDLSKSPLTLTEALDSTEIKVVLTKTRPSDMSKGVRVGGRVTRQTPLVLNAVTPVIDKTHPGDVINPVAFVTPRLDGSFQIEDVPPGRYTLGPSTGKGSVILDIAASDVTNLELDLNSSLPIVLSSTLMRSITGTVEVDRGTVPKFELGFSTTRTAPTTTRTAVVSEKEFAMSVPEGEYRASISGLPNGYKVESVTAGPLDLTYPFLVTSKGISDRFTGNPILIRPNGQPVPVSAGITVRLKAPLSEK